MKTKMTRFFTPTWMPKELIKLNNFATQLPDNPLNFLWPSEEFMFKHELSSCPKLIAVRTKGI